MDVKSLSLRLLAFVIVLVPILTYVYLHTLLIGILLG